MKTDSPDLFIVIITAFTSAIGITMCLFFLLIAVAIFAWWAYSNFFSDNITVSVVGIKAREKDTKIEEIRGIKTVPCNMYSPLLSIGTINSSQNWIPEKWMIGSKIKLSPGAEHEIFNETAGYGFLIAGLVLSVPALYVLWHIPFNSYTLLFVALFVAHFIFKLARKGRLAALYGFMKKSREERKKIMDEKRAAFRLRRKQDAEEEKKEWRKLSSQEVSEILKGQYGRFIRITVPFLMVISGSLLFAAHTLWLKTSEAYINHAPHDATLPPLTHLDAQQFFLAVFLGILAVFIFFKTIIKAFSLKNKINSPPVIF